MNSGRFFRVDDQFFRDSLFRKFIYLNVDNEDCYIYVTISENSLEFHYNLIGDLEHTRLFRINLLNANVYPRILSDQLNKIRKGRRHQLKIDIKSEITKKSPIASYTNLTYKKDNVKTPIVDDKERDEKQIFSEVNYDFGHKTLDIQEDKGIISEICLSTLLLDFLFDLKHSTVFQESPYFSTVTKLVEEHPLFQTIIAKWEFYYQYKLTDSYNNNSIVNEDVMTAGLGWCDLLMDSKNVALLSKSPWINPLEKELHNVLSLLGNIPRLEFTKKSIKNEITSEQRDNLKTQIENLTQQKEKLFVDAEAWVIGRFNYRSALSMARRQDPNIWIPLGTILLLPLVLIIWFLQCDILFYFLTVIWGIGVGRSLVHFKANKHAIKRWLNLLLPRLTLTIFTTWLALYAFSIEKIPNTGVIGLAMLTLFVVILVFAYLIKEIGTSVPDISDFISLSKKSGFIMLWSFTLSGLIGGIFISNALQSGGEILFCENAFNSGYDIAFGTWWTGTIFACYIGLFTNLLFRGQKFMSF